MPRDNSLSSSEGGRSLTPDLDEEMDRREALARFQQAQEEEANRSASTSDTAKTSAEREHVLPTVSHAAPPANHRPGLRPPAAGAGSTPGDRFRASVRKVMQLHRTSSAIASRGVGAEPGIDPRRASAFQHFGHLRAQCAIEIVEYNSVRSNVRSMNNADFVRFMQDAKACKPEPWVKVRWINIGGISWDVISSLALRYDLHPLALEDVLQPPRHARSKADYFHKHLFLRILCHTLLGADEKDDGSMLAHHDTSPSRGRPAQRQYAGMPRSTSPGEIGAESDDEKGYMSKKRGSMRKRTKHSDVEKARGMSEKSSFSAPDMSATMSKAALQRKQNLQIIDELTKGQRINVKLASMCLFLLRDGTVITIHPSTNLDFTTPISARVRQRDSVLRTSADASLLIESVLDLIVDRALEVIDEYQAKIVELEHEVLMKPRMDTVKYLHIIQGDIILHQRTLDPIKTVTYGLRRYDQDRCAALVADTAGPNVDLRNVEGYMSHKSKIYLADVVDHMDYVLTSLDMFAGITENLINYTFNMSSNEMNEVMRKLTLITMICLPLTLLTGYFGMNFEHMWSVQHNSDVLFWIIALPVLVIVIPLFMWSDFKKLASYIGNRKVDHRVHKQFGGR